MNAPRRVLVVDDSAIVRRLVEAQLGLRPGLVVVGSVGSSEAALAAIDALQPDLVLMDACMPGMDGVEGARAVRARSAARVVLMTGSTGAEFRRYQVLGLSAGATCVLQKDGVGQGGFYDTVESVASEGRVRGVAPPAPAAPTSKPIPRVVGIVASTGGPQTLVRVLGGLPASFPSAVLLVQHMSDGFEASFRDMMATHTKLEVKLAAHGDELRPGRLLIAPPGSHMVTQGDRVRLDLTSPAEQGHKPSGDRLLHSLARSHGAAAWGVVLTGMGADGAEGLLAMRRAGCHTLAQDSGAILDGMPARARALGAAELVQSDAGIGAYLGRLAGR